MTGLLVLLMFVWFGVSLLGAMVQGLFWLTLIAIALLMGTGALAWVRSAPRSEFPLPGGRRGPFSRHGSALRQGSFPSRVRRPGRAAH